MKKVFLCFLVITCFAFSNENPKVTTYSYGHNGMEYIAKNINGTIIISTFNAKMNIRQDIATKIYLMYIDNQLETNKKITVCGNEAEVIGKCVITKKDKLTAVDFYYETINWSSGEKEIFKKKLK